MKYQVKMVNNDRETDTITVFAENDHYAMLNGEEEYGRPGWHAESAKRIYDDKTN